MSEYLTKSLKEGKAYDQIIPIDVSSYSELVEKMKSIVAIKPTSTGLNELDSLMGGFENGRMYVLSAPTKQGKTTLAQSLMYLMAKKGLPSMIFSYEMGWQEITKKFMAMDLMKNQQTTNLPLYLPIELHRGGGELQYQWLFEAIYKAKTENGVKLVVIDHLHFLLPLKDYQNTSFIIGGIVREIKRMAVALDVPIILIAHVQKIKDDKVPDWTDIRDSSFITQEADVVLMMYRKKNENTAKKVTDNNTLETYSNEAFLSLELDRVSGKSGKIKLIHNGIMFEPSLL